MLTVTVAAFVGEMVTAAVTEGSTNHW